MCDTYSCNYLQHSTVRFNLKRFPVKYRISFPNFAVFFLQENHLALLKDLFLKKMHLKEQKPVAFFFSQNYRLK